MHHQTLSPKYKQRGITRIRQNNGETKSAKTNLNMGEKNFKPQESFKLKQRSRIFFFTYNSSLF